MEKSKSKAKSKAVVKVNVNVNSRNKYLRRPSSNIRQPMMYPTPPIVIQQHSTPQAPIVINQPVDTSRTQPVGITIHNKSYSGSGEPPKSGEEEPQTNASMVGSGLKVAGEVLEHVSPTLGKVVKGAGRAVETAGGIAQTASNLAEKFPKTTAAAAGLLTSKPAAIEQPLGEKTIPQLKSFITGKGGSMSGKSKWNKVQLLEYANTL